MSGIPSKNINYLLQYLVLPLVQTQPGVCGGQQRLQGGVQLIQLNSELGKTVVALVVHWHCICMTQTDRKEDPPPPSVYHPRIIILLTTCRTGSPDTGGRWRLSAVNRLVPLPEEFVDDVSFAVCDDAFHLVHAGIPVLGLRINRRQQ